MRLGWCSQHNSRAADRGAQWSCVDSWQKQEIPVLPTDWGALPTSYSMSGGGSFPGSKAVEAWVQDSLHVVSRARMSAATTRLPTRLHSAYIKKKIWIHDDGWIHFCTKSIFFLTENWLHQSDGHPRQQCNWRRPLYGAQSRVNTSGVISYSASKPLWAC